MESLALEVKEADLLRENEIDFQIIKALLPEDDPDGLLWVDPSKLSYATELLCAICDRLVMTVNLSN
jgi:hypothetical protein